MVTAPGQDVLESAILGSALFITVKEFITVDYQSFLMHTGLIDVRFFPIVNSLGFLCLSMKVASQCLKAGQARATLLAHGLILSTY